MASSLGAAVAAQLGDRPKRQEGTERGEQSSADTQCA